MCNSTRIEDNTGGWSTKDTELWACVRDIGIRSANVEYEWISWECHWTDLLASLSQMNRLHFVCHSLTLTRLDLSSAGREIGHLDWNKTSLHSSNPNPMLFSTDTSKRPSNSTSISVWFWLLSSLPLSDLRHDDQTERKSSLIAEQKRTCVHVQLICSWYRMSKQNRSM